MYSSALSGFLDSIRESKHRPHTITHTTTKPRPRPPLPPANTPIPAIGTQHRNKTHSSLASAWRALRCLPNTHVSALPQPAHHNTHPDRHGRAGVPRAHGHPPHPRARVLRQGQRQRGRGRRRNRPLALQATAARQPPRAGQGALLGRPPGVPQAAAVPARADEQAAAGPLVDRPAGHGGQAAGGRGAAPPMCTFAWGGASESQPAPPPRAPTPPPPRTCAAAFERLLVCTPSPPPPAFGRRAVGPVHVFCSTDHRPPRACVPACVPRLSFLVFTRRAEQI